MIDHKLISEKLYYNWNVGPNYLLKKITLLTQKSVRNPLQTTTLVPSCLKPRSQLPYR